MKKRYLKLMRQAYRSLRNRRLRRIAWLQNLIQPLFSRQLWRPCKETVAKGFSIGIFFSMIPVPGQMLAACLVTAKAKGNIPFNILACWLSNPFTILPILVLQESFGDWIERSLGIEHNLCDSLDRFELVASLRQALHIPQDFHTGALVLGVIFSAVILSVTSYVFVHAIGLIFSKKIEAELTPKQKQNKVDTTSLNS